MASQLLFEHTEDLFPVSALLLGLLQVEAEDITPASFVIGDGEGRWRYIRDLSISAGYNNLKGLFFIEKFTHPQYGTFAIRSNKKNGEGFSFPRYSLTLSRRHHFRIYSNFTS